MVVLAAGQQAVLGRDDLTVTIQLSDPGVSRRHAVIGFDGRQGTVEDLQSTNGTFLNGRRVTSPQRVMTGDAIQVGGVRVVVLELPCLLPDNDGAGAAEALPDDLDAVVRDPATVATFLLALRLARSNLSILLQGETGTGKEVLASVIHQYSARAAGPFVAINCATLNEALAESLLFGHERGSFTGAFARQVGAFEAAHGGTLFLDEVGELSPSNQARLLRALEDGAILRVGAVRPLPVDVRVISATNRDLSAEIGWRRFRADLFFRLNGAAVTIPPLRQRPRDIAHLVERFLADAGAEAAISRAAMNALHAYAWPGNIRELRNALEHALAVSLNGVIDLCDRVAGVERDTIVSALQATQGNQSRAARLLGITRRALIYRMELHGLKARPHATM
jgi:transcriptional regulator with PAS, ATPase and Fis domain